MSTLVDLPTLPVAAPSGRDSSERDRLIRRAKALSWLSLAWMTVEGTVAVTAALIAGSVALLGFGIDSAIEGLASVIVIWRFTGACRVSEQAERRAQKAVAISFFLLAPYIAEDAIRTLIASDHPSMSWVGERLVDQLDRRDAGARPRQAKPGRATRVGGDRWGGFAEPAVRLHGRRRARRHGRERGAGWWWVDPVVALVIAAIGVREGREAWAGGGCACVAIPGLQTDSCHDDCR